MSERRKVKTEHAGAKNGGGFWGYRVEAKAISRKVRRERGKSEVREALTVPRASPGTGGGAMSDMPEWDGRFIDPSQFPDCDRDGHRMVNCGDGVYRCCNCMTERRVFDGDGRRRDGTR